MTTKSTADDVFISEVGGAGRWSQFSPTFRYVRDFFGTEPQNPYNILLRHVTSTGVLQSEERPICIFKASSNWAFELGAATELDYPEKTNRPIVVFLKSDDGGNGSGAFLYTLLMPGDPGYQAMTHYLADHASAGQLRRTMLSSDVLKTVWPSSPLWKHWP